MTYFPMALNIVNPRARKYYAPPCRNCGCKCENCPLPLSKSKTLNQLFGDLAHKTKFDDNKGLYVNQNEFSRMQDSDDDDEENKFGINSNNWSKWGNNNQNSDEEEVDKEEKARKRAEKEDRRGRLKIFSLEFLFINRILKTDMNSIKAKLLSFDAHPRAKKEEERVEYDSYGRKKKPRMSKS